MTPSGTCCRTAEASTWSTLPLCCRAGTEKPAVAVHSPASQARLLVLALALRLSLPEATADENPSRCIRGRERTALGTQRRKSVKLKSTSCEGHSIARAVRLDVALAADESDAAVRHGAAAEPAPRSLHVAEQGPLTVDQAHIVNLLLEKVRPVLNRLADPNQPKLAQPVVCCCSEDAAHRTKAPQRLERKVDNERREDLGR